MSRGGIQESSVLNLIYTCITGWVFEDIYDLSQSHLEDRILSTVVCALVFMCYLQDVLVWDAPPVLLHRQHCPPQYQPLHQCISHQVRY